MLEQLKQTVLEENLSLATYHLVTFTWGNVSEISSDRRYVVIKPSGMEYAKMTANDMVVVDLAGNVVEGKRKPSSDLMTHLTLYKAFGTIGGVVHTHSRWATIFAQMCSDIPCMGTTHADTFGGAVPCTDILTTEQINGDYEYETGKAITTCFLQRGISPEYIPAANVARHGPFCWGRDAAEAVHNAVVLEECAMMAWHTLAGKQSEPIPKELLDRHFYRKHGPNAYYGQG